ncbi:hypothetical protein BKA67DRAFT_654295 [Truncatella angustata]|uniref:Uncharacterized protein n=1 Tax=Truncatella angustata TaxID=152316 RepID=A0A9P9A5B7_9PEZI|nr:uncharacterized protein BKA67DRAFT_654295 [Truncatella angustata]KAH6661160.1 hypothetical protein BKA67DRAFT_654295 [Truncatella angustata]KAH8194240.1 hypothetical protein TruAng_011599 [Truncatella angustata]
MPDVRYPRKASPASSFGSYSRSPSPVYSRSRSRSRPGRRISFSRSPSRSRPGSRRTSRRDSLSSTSSSRSPSRDGRSKRTQVKEKLKDVKEKTDTTSGLKTSLVFLGSVAAATYAAHKFWPKGVTYGEKEEWEIEKAIRKEKKKAAERAGDGRNGEPSSRGDDRRDIEERRRDRDYDRPRSSLGRLGIEGVPRRADLDEVILVRRPVSVNRGQHGTTTMSVDGSRTGDARRAQYVEDNRTIRQDSRTYVETRDESSRAAPRYVDYEARRYSHDEPPDTRRGQPIVYTRRAEGYR